MLSFGSSWKQAQKTLTSWRPNPSSSLWSRRRLRPTGFPQVTGAFWRRACTSLDLPRRRHPCQCGAAASSPATLPKFGASGGPVSALRRGGVGGLANAKRPERDRLAEAVRAHSAVPALGSSACTEKRGGGGRGGGTQERDQLTLSTPRSACSPHLAFPFAESLRTRHAVGRGSGGARTLSEPRRGDDTRSRARTFLATLSV